VVVTHSFETLIVLNVMMLVMMALFCGLSFMVSKSIAAMARIRRNAKIVGI
jgi:hypothetical protein